uniref:Uncharacterized protein n=1 Tax=Oryzias sinensis TaxID=183150 RepID=A0A8C7X6G3_9TELE
VQRKKRMLLFYLCTDLLGICTEIKLNLSCLFSGWSSERVHEYFVWASEVVRNLKGTNSVLEGKLAELFQERGLTL